MSDKKYKIGLALSGGGAKGFAHCGALLALEEFGYKPDVVSGTSAGAIAGSAYCAGVDPFKIAEAFMGRVFRDFIKIRIPKAGIFDHEPLLYFIQEMLQGKGFEDLDIPMCVVTSDLDNGESAVFTQGDLAKSVQASASVPIVFPPVNIDGVNYVDGGLFRNFPVTPLKDICDIVIGVNVNPTILSDYKLNLPDVAMRSFYLMAQVNSAIDIPLCDILIELEELQDTSLFDLKNINKIFRIGYDSTVYQLEHNYKLIRKHPSRIKDLDPTDIANK